MTEYQDHYQITTQINPGILSHKLNKDHMDLLWSYIKDSTKRGGWVLDENNKVIERDDFQEWTLEDTTNSCLLYTSPSPRDRQKSRMPSSA